MNGICVIHRVIDLFFAGNAVDPERECGGSSGGEGSLIGSGGKFIYPKYYKHGLYLLWQLQI